MMMVVVVVSRQAEYEKARAYDTGSGSTTTTTTTTTTTSPYLFLSTDLLWCLLLEIKLEGESFGIRIPIRYEATFGLLGKMR